MNRQTEGSTDIHDEHAGGIGGGRQTDEKTYFCQFICMLNGQKNKSMYRPKAECMDERIGRQTERQKNLQLDREVFEWTNG